MHIPEDKKVKPTSSTTVWGCPLIIIPWLVQVILNKYVQRKVRYAIINNFSIVIMMLILVLIIVAYAQQQTSLTQPPFIETNTFSINMLSSSSSTIKTTFAYISSFNQPPLIYLSLVNMHTLLPLSTSTIRQRMMRITATNSEH